MSLIRVRGFFISTIYALFFVSHTIAGFLSVATLVFTEHSLTSFTVFTLLSILANVKFFATIFIGDSLIWIADSMVALRRMQRLLETKPVIESKISKRQNMSPLKVYFKGRRYKPHLVRTESFKPEKPALISLQRIKDFQAVQPQAVLEDISSLWNYSSDRPALQNVSLQASSGQLIGITGPVGSGKTQFLQHTDNVVVLHNGCVEYQGTFGHMEKETMGKFSIVSQRSQETDIDDHGNVVGEDEAVKSVNIVHKLGERVDLKEEEEDRMVGTVKWRLYWKYFRASLSTGLIFSLACFFAFAQGMNMTA